LCEASREQSIESSFRFSDSSILLYLNGPDLLDAPSKLFLKIKWW
jgi:hypothetical protein